MRMRRPVNLYPGQYSSQYSGPSALPGCNLSIGRILVGVVIAAIAIISFLGSKAYNPVTGQDQYVSLTPNQEIALGLQAAPEMIQEYGGEDTSPQAQNLVDKIGARLIAQSVASTTDWQFDFHVLNDNQTINAFALPGGQVFITDALLGHLDTEGEVASVLAHEMGHVVARHGAQQIAQSDLTSGLIGAVAVAASNPNDPNGANAAQIAAVVGQLVNLKYSRGDELEADQLGVRLMSEAGYDPRSMIKVMQILESTSEGDQPPEFFSTHPNSANRIQKIQEAIDTQFPNGVPDGLTQ